MSAHTPGPWTVTERSDHSEIHGNAGDELVCELPYINGNERSNARLIAAAPELLAALQGLVERGTDSPEHRAAEQAIARAVLAKLKESS